MRNVEIFPVKTVNVYTGVSDPIQGIVYYWKEGAALPENMPRCETIKLRHNGNYYSYEAVYSSFDIETTNITIKGKKKDDEKHLAFMYHWQFIIASNAFAYVIMGRTWPEFLDFMQAIQCYYNLDDDNRIIIWVANLGFEFQFIRKYFEWSPDDFFAREERHPMKARTGGFEFHEALSISGGSLAQLARDYTTTQKLIGDLDYDILRNSTTPMKSREMDYCINDVVILAEWSKFIFRNYIIPDKRIPLTKTGILRSETRQNMQTSLGVAGFRQYRELIFEAFPTPELYAYWFKYLFRGGYVHSNCLMTGFIIFGVFGVDITSSYPKEMLLEDCYPLTPFINAEFSEEAIKTKCCIMKVRFTNIRRRWAHSIESQSKAIELSGSKEMSLVIDNGRIAQAATLTVMLTNLDYENYIDFYKFEKMEILEFKTAEKGMLPRPIRQTLAKYYVLKAKLKKEDKQDTPEYVIAKQKVNSFFGMMVTRIELDKITYNNESDKWVVAEKELDFEEEIKSQFLLPQWGIFVTAAARRSLLSLTAKLTRAIGDGSGDNGAGVIYNDTDSIKYFDPAGKGRAIIDEYNAAIVEKRKKRKLTALEFDGLGEFDFEGYYDKFKTLGAKRYLTSEKGKVKATIAGLPKQSILNVKGDPFDKFDIDGMLLDAEVSLKKTISYNDEFTQAVINGELMQEESSAGIYDITFQMNLEKAYYCLVVDGLTERIRKYGEE